MFNYCIKYIICTFFIVIYITVITTFITSITINTFTFFILVFVFVCIWFLFCFVIITCYFFSCLIKLFPVYFEHVFIWSTAYDNFLLTFAPQFLHFLKLGSDITFVELESLSFNRRFLLEIGTTLSSLPKCCQMGAVADMF